MRRTIAMTVAVALTSVAANALEEETAALREAATSGDSARINQTLLQLNGAIKKHELVDQSSWDNPSAERSQRRHDIMAALQSIENELINLFKGPDHTLASNAAVVLGYTDGDDKVYEALKSVLSESTDASLPSKALYSLYQINRADAEVRAVAAERIAGYRERTQAQTAYGLLNLAAVWPLPEAVPVYREILASEARGGKMGAAKALMKLGPTAAEALPELRRFLAQLRAQGGDFRDINTLERAVRVVSGQTQPPEPAPTPAATAPATPIPSAPPIASPAPTTPAAQTPVPTVERRAPVWPWLVGILALTVISWLLWKRRT